MKIRNAKKTEVKVLQNLNDELFADNSKYDPDLKLNWAQSAAGKKYFSKVVNNPNAICLIAEEDGKPIGYIAAAPKDFDFRLSKYIEIENMGISPEYRSKGVGSELIKECLALAKKRGFHKAFVTSYFANFGAIKFYSKNGFRNIDLSLEREI